MRRTIVFAGGWLAAVVASALLGLSVIAGPTGPPLTPADITDALARGTASPPPPSVRETTGPSPAVTSAGVRRYFTSAGGTVWATCTGGLVSLSAVTPSQGYQIHDRDLGPATSARVSFRLDVRHGHAAEYELNVTCAGEPQGHWDVN
jgi:hypothetical protein